MFHPESYSFLITNFGNVLTLVLIPAPWYVTHCLTCRRHPDVSRLDAYPIQGALVCVVLTPLWYLSLTGGPLRRQYLQQ